ncbi:biotin--[acetyl-CoA-carboxylase] ligase [Lysinibacter sp. HNR]|uniref:biotin--[acetyl-CoA-carboxylase] ligase n=1 Tax=Lysinibacter sp. HNR TaxID=3031408 RepID=UPI0024352B45|nr:biotin--[acetyl-CoA-carboxylase] ligase [Lysinibacter sp. HNR]WGD38051.1 biotin--[acetyl-CoA-carboxylase] ligase [Lysinibacter sp. HNR]
MELPLSRIVTPQLLWLERVGSTNAHLSHLNKIDVIPDKSVVATDNQVSGRGRLDRSWVTPPHTSLAVSALRCRIAPSLRSLVPLVTGSALAATLRPLVPRSQVSVKWPNDVQIDGLKVAGILCEVGPNDTIIIGTGINLTMSAEELPTATATSLRLQGARSVDIDTILAHYLTELFARTDALLSEREDTDSPPQQTLVTLRQDSATLGQHVIVHLPDGRKPVGLARDIDNTGRLVVEVSGESSPLIVSAGDVVHLRAVDNH